MKKTEGGFVYDDKLHERIESLCSSIAFFEGKKHQAQIGDIREIVRLLAGLSVRCPWVVGDLIAYGLAPFLKKTSATSTAKKPGRRRSKKTKKVGK